MANFRRGSLHLPLVFPFFDLLQGRRWFRLVLDFFADVDVSVCGFESKFSAAVRAFFSRVFNLSLFDCDISLILVQLSTRSDPLQELFPILSPGVLLFRQILRLRLLIGVKTFWFVLNIFANLDVSTGGFRSEFAITVGASLSEIFLIPLPCLSNLRLLLILLFYLSPRSDPLQELFPLSSPLTYFHLRFFQNLLRLVTRCINHVKIHLIQWVDVSGPWFLLFDLIGLLFLLLKRQIIKLALLGFMCLPSCQAQVRNFLFFLFVLRLQFFLQRAFCSASFLMMRERLHSESTTAVGARLQNILVPVLESCLIIHTYQIVRVFTFG